MQSQLFPRFANTSIRLKARIFFSLPPGRCSALASLSFTCAISIACGLFAPNAGITERRYNTAAPFAMSFLRSLPPEAGLLQVFQAVPEAARPLLEYHEVLLRGESPFSAAERELIAAYVSGLNSCNYCRA